MTRSAMEADVRDPQLVALGERIAAARRAAGYRRQEDLAEALGVARQTIGFMEQGRMRVPVLKAARLARLIDIPLADLVEIDDADRRQLRALEVLDRAGPEHQDELLDLLERFVRMLPPTH